MHASGVRLTKSGSCHLTHDKLIAVPHQPRIGRRQLACSASLHSGPAYNKYRSRQDIERDYFKDWEQTTLLAEEEIKRPMTFVTFLQFLPTWFKYYVIPGPVRFAWYLIWQRVLVAAHIAHRYITLKAAQAEVALQRKQGKSGATIDKRIVMLRFHHKTTLLQDLRYRLQLLQGKDNKEIYKTQ